MLVRVCNFVAAYPELFEKGSLPAQLAALLRASVEKLSGHATTWTLGQGALRTSSGSRKAARAALGGHLEVISQTARGMNIEGFWMPRNRSEEALVHSGKAFASEAQPLVKDFVEHGLPADFIEKLNAAVKDLEQATGAQTNSKRTSAFSTFELEEVRKEAMSALDRLDTVLTNVLRDQPSKLQIWERARHIERARSSKTQTEAKPAPQASPAPSPPANPDATAATV
jgi:hypothetical protein